MAKELKPRLLRVLRIDDDLPEGLPPEPLPPQFSKDLPPAFLEPVFFGSGEDRLMGIRSWESAVNFWKEFQNASVVDLVLSDVRFSDGTSPLSRLSEGLELPTGLGHFKLFAAMARLRGSPIGVALHTADSMTWEIAAREGDPLRRAMAMLAAHEIGELAALLGDADEIPEGGAEACWKWLKASTARSGQFRQAIPLALEKYRQQIARARVLPEDWERAAGWCAGMVMRCRQSDTGLVRLQEDADDPGLTIIRDDGVRDAISFRSLFADVPLTNSGFEYEYTGLPEASFDLAPVPDFHLLSPDHLPRIGALVAACGEVSRAYKAALSVLGAYHIQRATPAAQSLTDFLSRGRFPRLAGGLAILLQHIAYQDYLHKAWHTLFLHQPYDPGKDAFFHGEGTALVNWLDRIMMLARKEGEISGADIQELFHDTAGRSGAVQKYALGATERCVDLLKRTGHLVLDPESGAFKPSQVPRLTVAPALAADPPANFAALAGLGEALSLGRGLRDQAGVLLYLFGHDQNHDFGRNEDNHNALQRIVRDAFGLRDNTEATRFLEAFRRGSMPPWVRAICRQYAEQVLNWTDQASWSQTLADGF